jgi:hypothetical protein
MSCRFENTNTDTPIIRAENGKESILFESLLRSSKSSSEAVKKYMAVDNAKADLLAKFPGVQTDLNGEFVLTPEIDSWAKEKAGFIRTEAKPLGVSTSFSQIRNNLRTVLDIQEKRYAKAREGGKSSKAELFEKNIATIRENLQDVEGLDGGLITFIQVADHYLQHLQTEVAYLKTSLQKYGTDPTWLTSERITDILVKLNNIKDFSSTFMLLDDLAVQLMGNQTITPDLKAALDRSINMKQSIFSEYSQLALDIATEWVYPYMDRLNTSLASKGDSKYIISKAELRRMFQIADQDVGFFNSWLGAGIASENPLNSVIIKIVKDHLENARKVDIDVQADLFNAFEKASGPKNNAREFNSKYIRTISVKDRRPLIENGKNVLDSNGVPVMETVYVMQKAIHQPYKYDEVAKSRDEFIAKYGEMPTDPEEKLRWQRRFYDEWWSVNNRALGNQEINAILKVKLDTFSGTRAEKVSKLRDWIAKNSADGKTFTAMDGVGTENGMVEIPWLEEEEGLSFYFRPSVRSPFFVPNDKYKNPEFEKLKSDPYFRAIYKAYTEANMKYPYNSRLRYGMLPQVRKTGFDALSSASSMGEYVSRIKSDLSLITHHNEAVDTQYGGDVIQDITGKKHYFLPTPYVAKLDYSEISDDLLSSVLKFSQAASRYDAMAEIQPHIETVSALIFGVKNIKDLGRGVVTGLKKQVEYHSSNANKQLETALETTYWGREVEKLEPWKIKIRDKEYSIAPDKILSNLGFLTALSKMAGNLLAGINNLTLGELGNFIEAMSGKYGSRADWAKAEAFYVAQLPNLMADIGKSVDRSKLSLMLEYFDAIQGEFRDQYGDAVSGNRLKNLWNMNSLFFVNNSAEHKIQATGALMRLMMQKVRTTSGKEISMYDAYEKVGNKVKLKKKKGIFKIV